MSKRQFTAEFKTKVVLELLKEEQQIGELAVKHEISPNQLRNWRTEFLEKAVMVFSESKQAKEIKSEKQALESERAELLCKIGQLIVENDWLKKKSTQVLGANWETKSGFKK